MKEVHDRKKHFANLPHITANDMDYAQGTKDDVCVIIPVFGAGDIKILKDYTHAACHAMRSWLLNTDITDASIPIYLYLDERYKTDIAPIVEQNNIPEGFVKWSSTFLEGAQTGNKFAPIFDESFQFKHLFMSDVDMFAIRDAENTIVNFSDTYLAAEDGDKTFGAIGTFEQKGPIFQVEYGQHWWDWSFQPPNSENMRKEVRQLLWLNAIASLTSDEVVSKVMSTETLKCPLTALLYVNPLKADKEWITKAVNLLSEDEATIFAHSLYDTPYWDINCNITDPYGDQDTWKTYSGLLHWWHVSESDEIIYKRIFGGIQ